MKITYEIDDDILIIYQNGVNDTAQVRDAMAAAFSGPNLQKGTHLLWATVDAPTVLRGQ